MLRQEVAYNDIFLQEAEATDYERTKHDYYMIFHNFKSIKTKKSWFEITKTNHYTLEVVKMAKLNINVI